MLPTKVARICTSWANGLMFSPSQIDGCGIYIHGSLPKIYSISLSTTFFSPFVHLVEPMNSTSVNYLDCFVLLELLNEHTNVIQ